MQLISRCYSGQPPDAIKCGFPTLSDLKPPSYPNALPESSELDHRLDGPWMVGESKGLTASKLSRTRSLPMPVPR